MKKLIIFDLDGTLCDTSTDIMDNINKTLIKFGYPEVTLQETKDFTGNGARVLITRALKGKPCLNFEEVLAFYNNSYNHCQSPKTKVYNGIYGLLNALKKDGFKLAVVSNKPQEGTNEVIGKFFPNTFDYIIGQRQGVKVKPDRALIDLLLNEAHITASESVFIGDSEVDAQTAINAQVDLISVLWGFRDKQRLLEVGATEFCENADELYRKIIKYC